LRIVLRAAQHEERRLAVAHGPVGQTVHSPSQEAQAWSPP
jgi:hypothetical protein